MKTFLIVFALLGSTLSLIVNKQYTYRYEGRLGVGIPQIRNRVAGTGIKATVVAQVQSQSQVVIQLSDVQVGQFLGDVDCGSGGPMPIKYSPMPGVEESLGKPFAINLQSSHEDVMVVPETEKEWETNIRKSIISLFLIDPIRGSFGVQGERVSGLRSKTNKNGTYSVMEPSIFGSCDSVYTVESPVQRAESGYNYYNMTRVIDFNKCMDQVILQQTGLGNAKQVRENQFEDVSSRSSIMTAQLKPEGDSFVVQSGRVEGHFMLNPFGVSHEKLMSITNQTFHLVSEESISHQFQVPNPNRKLNSWFMSVASPFEGSVNSPSWVNFYNNESARYMPILAESSSTGLPLTASNISNFANTLENLLSEAATLISRVGSPPNPRKISPFNTDESKIISQLESAFRVVRALDISNLEKLFDKFYNDKSDVGHLKLTLFIDVCSVSGMGAPIKTLLSEIQKGRVGENRIASIFYTFANNFVMAPIISDITGYIKTLSMEKTPFLASTVWINYASALSRACLNPDKYRYTTPRLIFGKEECDTKRVIQDILPFFKSEFDKTEEPSKQVVIVHAIGNLGCVDVLSTLSEIAHGPYHPHVRAAAIYSMDFKKIPRSLRNRIFELLMPVVTNTKENSYLRQVATSVLLSWSPDASWFQSMAAYTWWEPSDDMASFVYFMLKDLSKVQEPMFQRDAKIAQFALPLAKAYSPSWRFSYTFFWNKFIQKDFLDTEFSVESVMTEPAQFPMSLCTFLANSFGGYRFKAFQLAYAAEPSPWSSLLKNLPEGLQKLVRSAPNRRGREGAVEDMRARMSSSSSSSSSTKHANIFFSLFDNLEILAPISYESISALLGKDGSRFLKSLSEEQTLHANKFINPAPIEVMLPTELGIPSFAKVSVPVLNAGEAHMNVTVDGHKFNSWSDIFSAQTVNASFSTNYKFIAKTLVSLRALTPWNQKLVAGGVETMKSLTLPMNISVSFDRTSEIKNVSISIRPVIKNQLPVLHAHTIPFVTIKGMWPGQDPKEYDAFKVISVLGGEEGTVKRDMAVNQGYTGIKAKLTFEGDVSYPYTWGNVQNLIRHPERVSELMMSPSVRMWSTTFVADVASSASQEAHFSLAYARNLASIKQAPAFISEPIRHSDSYAIISNVLLNGTQTRYFESSYTVSPAKRGGGQQSSLFSWNYGRSALPSYDPKPASTCLKLVSSYPEIRDVDSLRRVLSGKVEFSTKGNLYAGQSCDKSYAQIDGSLALSDERRQRLVKELNENCISDPADPLVGLTTPAVYDESKLDIKYEKNIPSHLQNVTYHIYDIMRGWTYPHSYFNYLNVKNAEDKISVRGQRFLGESRWSLRASLPTENVVVDHFRVPYIFDQILPYGGFSKQSSQDKSRMILRSSFTAECEITKSKVKAFDGYSYSYKPENCETYAVIDRDDRRAPSLLTSVDYNTKRFEGIIVSSSTESKIVFNTSVVSVNGREVHLTSKRTPLLDRNGAFFADALKTSEYVQVTVPGNFSVRLSDDSISVTPSPNMRKKLAGLCGSFSGNSTRELAGPKHCLYSDAVLFAQSWTSYAKNKGCNMAAYRREQEAVERYQKNCPKVTPSNEFVATPKSPLSSVPHDCLAYVYKTLKKDGNICVTQNPIPMCYPLCKTSSVDRKIDQYDCWTAEKAPKELKRNVRRGYIKHKVHNQPMKTMTFETEHASVCSKN